MPEPSLNVEEAARIASNISTSEVNNNLKKVSAIEEIDKENHFKNLLLNPDIKYREELCQLVQSMMKQGGGETIFRFDASEKKGTPLCLTDAECQVAFQHLKDLGEALKLTVTPILYKPDTEVGIGFLIRRIAQNVENVLEVRTAVVGNVDAGKSTLLGVITKGVLDDGRGKARVNLFKHKHELESGRTSSVGAEILGFDDKGKVISHLAPKKLPWDVICKSSSKVVTFFDLAGHERYLKTTVFGMSGCSPDYVMLLVGSNAGLVGMTKEHLGLALALAVPVFIVITKIDMCPQSILAQTKTQLLKVLKSSGCKKIPMFIASSDDCVGAAQNFVNQRICPIFQVSSVKGDGLENLKFFLNLLPVTTEKYKTDTGAHYQITETFTVPGVGTVVNGTVLSGIVHSGDTLLLGPDSTGQFVPTLIKSIHRKCISVPQASAGQSATMALKKIKRSSIRKGMVLLSKELNPVACTDFEAEILILFHSTTIAPRYQAVLHCGNVRQAARIVKMDRERLRTGDRAIVHFSFLRMPEYVKPGTRILFREGRTKGVGKVVCVSHTARVIIAMRVIEKDKEEKALYYVKLHSLYGALAGGAVGILGSYYADKRYLWYKNLRPSAKIFLITMSTMTGFAIAADKALIRAEVAERLPSIHDGPNASPKGFSLDTVKKSLLENRFSIVALTWGATVWGSMIYLYRDPYQTVSQKVVQARMVAQGSTVVALIATAGLMQLTMQNLTPTRNVIPSWEKRLEELEFHKTLEAVSQPPSSDKPQN